MNNVHERIRQELQSTADTRKARDLARFFKTGEGGYGQGDLFYGVSVPFQRRLVRRYGPVSDLDSIELLLDEPYHECRLTALLLLVYLFEHEKEENTKGLLVSFYLSHTHRIDNWDLVDSSCYKILGPYLLDKDRAILFELASSNELWQQRIAVITTLCFIRSGSYETTLKLADLLLDHRHDLIHKAVGWMLREIGNRSQETLLTFLGPRYRSMPRTMLRYAIERLDEPLRKAYLHGSV